jgi:L-alanine-DL-glutamate epimerase-like enolase superfamily enzyme
MMQIIRVDVERYVHGEAEVVAEILIVRVHTDEGHEGMGFMSSRGKIGQLSAQIIETVLAPAVTGMDPRLHVDCWNRMYAAAPRRAADGLVRHCIAAVDFALWDLKGRVLGVPVSHLLGAHRERVPTYANCAHHLPVDQLAVRAAEYVAKGHRAMKIRGTRTFVSPAEATARVAAVREAVGPDVRLMVDVNGTWDVDTAIAQLKQWENYDVYWLEEPVPPTDVAGYVRVRERAGSTFIAGGEQHVGLAEFKPFLDAGAVDIAQPNAAMTGGITDWLPIHAYATALSIPVSPWNLQPIHLHLAAGLPNVLWIEYFMPDNALLEFQTRLFNGPLTREEITDEGVFLRSSAAPGLGLELDPDVAASSRA